MTWMVVGAVFTATLFHAGAAQADPANADTWIGVSDTTDGFLLDEETGSVWMTGICLRPVGVAQKTSGVWHARLVEMVSVGRGRTRLEQTFILDTQEASPSIQIINPDRGGEQTIENVVVHACTDRAAPCARALQGPTC
ncbi:MAG: hypothetical protein AAGI03_00145 [Pseudomonadota bacterium]